MSNNTVKESIAAFRSFVNSPLFESSLNAVLATAGDQPAPVKRARRTRTPKVQPSESNESSRVQGQPMGQLGQRGRVPGVYFVTQTGRNLRGVSDVVKTVYAHMSTKPEGVTMKQIQDDLKMPHSTVWFCINKLKNRHVLKVEFPDPAKVETPADNADTKAA